MKRKKKYNLNLTADEKKQTREMLVSDFKKKKKKQK